MDREKVIAVLNKRFPDGLATDVAAAANAIVGIDEGTEVVFRRILLTTDFSEASDEALRYARAVARLCGAQLHMLHVVQDPFVQPWAAEAYGISLPSLLEELEHDARARLEKMLVEPGHERAAIEVATRVGSPHEQIIEYAKTTGIDLIVMGTHARGGIAHALLGSVAEKVVRLAPCPVLVARQHR